MKTQRTRQRTNRPNPLKTATTALEDAVHALCNPQPHRIHANEYFAGDLAWTPSRYEQLADAIDITASHTGYGGGNSGLNVWIDPLMLKMSIDLRAQTATGARAPTPLLLRTLAQVAWRPQDTEHLEALTAEIHGWCKAVDDLFAPKPAYLDAACPQCGQTKTHIIQDDGDRVGRPALAVSVERGAWCQACHQDWPLDRLPILARLIGTMPQTVPA